MGDVSRKLRAVCQKAPQEFTATAAAIFSDVLKQRDLREFFSNQRADTGDTPFGLPDEDDPTALFEQAVGQLDWEEPSPTDAPPTEPSPLPPLEWPSSGDDDYDAEPHTPPAIALG